MSTVLITGASSVLGQEIAKVFALNGARLALMMYKNNVAKVCLDKYLGAHLSPGSWSWYQGSLSERERVAGFVKKVSLRLGDIDVMIHNAGINHTGALIKLSNQDWENVFDTNINACFFMAKLVLPRMLNNKNGHFIHVSSFQALKGSPFVSPYVASKAALIGFSQSIAKEYGGQNIRSNVILPGYMDSKITEKNTSEFRQKVLEENCLKRLNDPREVARFVYFLTTMKNISGQVFNLDSRVI